MNLTICMREIQKQIDTLQSVYYTHLKASKNIFIQPIRGILIHSHPGSCSFAIFRYLFVESSAGNVYFGVVVNIPYSRSHYVAVFTSLE